MGNTKLKHNKETYFHILEYKVQHKNEWSANSYSCYMSSRNVVIGVTEILPCYVSRHLKSLLSTKNSCAHGKGKYKLIFF
jgi:hypothetical protein